MHPRITRREWSHALIWALALMALTCAPYIANTAAQTGEWVFGGSVLGVTDGNSYLAKMRQGARGGWLFHIVYTPEEHDGALLFLPYLVLGRVAALFADPSSPELVPAMIAVFHSARVIFGVLLILMTYRFIAAFLVAPSARLAATALITAGGGLGWLLALFGQGEALGSQPVDFYVPEGYTFLILYHLPHMALARALLLAGLLMLLDQPGEAPADWRPCEPFAGRRRPRTWLPQALMAGLCWVGVGLCVPFYLAVLYAILGAWGIGLWLRRRRFPWGLFWSAAAGASVTLPLLVYTAYHFITNAAFAQWSAQNRLPSPHPLHYIAGYLVFLLPAFWGIRWAWGTPRATARGRAGKMLLVSWVAVAPVLAYLPVNVQRRLVEAIIVPLGILAVAGLRAVVAPWLARRLHIWRRRAWSLSLGLMLALALPTNLLLVAGGIASAARPGWPVFHPAAEIAAMDWLAAHAPGGAVVLGAFETGNYLPVRADVRVFLGHGPETLFADEKQRTVEAFFRRHMNAGERKALYREYDIAYVFYGPQEGAEPGAPPPAWSTDLDLVYAAGEYSIFAVRQ